MRKATLTGRKRYFLGDKCKYFVEGTQPDGWQLGTPSITKEKASVSVKNLWKSQEYKDAQHTTRHSDEYHTKMSENMIECWKRDKEIRSKSMTIANKKRFEKSEEHEKCRNRMLEKWSDRDYYETQCKSLSEAHKDLYTIHPEYKSKISDSMKVTWQNEKEHILQKQYITKSANKSWNTSKLEETYYNELLQKYEKSDVIRQYKDDARYPFNCDFYIKSEDRFIELQGTWCHGGHLFNSSNEEDRKKLEVWQEKAKTSKYYQKAIEVWTVTDVLKYNTAIQNNLNINFIY